ncbi:MAG TPA: AI-2E family transporter [Pyrinomonadaceae bacterium]|nr:AI-2E family transporter [Pyrinomonadaceae bacterium]
MTPSEQSNWQFVNRVLIVVGVVILAILLVVGVFYVFDVILLLFGAVLLAIFLHGLAEIVIRYTNLSEGLAVLLVSVILVAALAFGIWLLAPDVAEQIRILRGKIPESAQNLSTQISQYSWGRVLIEQFPSAEQIIDTLNNASFLTRVGGYFSTTIGIIGNLLLVILMAIYLASEPRFYVRGFLRLFPENRRQRALVILKDIVDTLGWWLIGKFASMLFIGITTWIGLYFLGVPLSLSLGLIAGLLAFIPNFGPILSVIPAVLLAFIESPIKAVYVLALYIGVQVVESNIVTPYIERRTIELPPVLTISAQLALGILLGGIGLVLATPLLAAAMVLVQTIYIEDVLGESLEEPVDTKTDLHDESAADETQPKTPPESVPD